MSQLWLFWHTFVSVVCVGNAQHMPIPHAFSLTRPEAVIYSLKDYVSRCICGSRVPVCCLTWHTAALEKYSNKHVTKKDAAIFPSFFSCFYQKVAAYSARVIYGKENARKLRMLCDFRDRILIHTAWLLSNELLSSIWSHMNELRISYNTNKLEYKAKQVKPNSSCFNHYQAYV